jgi:hypothetical protein
MLEQALHLRLPPTEEGEAMKCDPCGMTHDGPTCLVCNQPTFFKGGFFPRYMHVHHEDDGHTVVLSTNSPTTQE